MKEIINKEVLTQQEVEYVVEQYIKDKTGKTVKIRIDSLDPFSYQFQLQKLMDAFGYAYCHYQSL